MKERPILFSAPMIQAILEGRKTQTRRILSPQPDIVQQGIIGPLNSAGNLLVCKHGQPNDRLWVRETHYIVYAQGNKNNHAIEIDYKADPNYTRRMCPQKWSPSIHMPRWASRILLQVKATSVERLQDISANDAIAEGIEYADSILGRRWRCYTKPDSWYPDGKDTAPIHSFQSLWNSINGDFAWNDNPWVWKIEFNVLETTCKFWS